MGGERWNACLLPAMCGPWVALMEASARYKGTAVRGAHPTSVWCVADDRQRSARRGELTGQCTWAHHPGVEVLPVLRSARWHVGVCAGLVLLSPAASERQGRRPSFMRSGSGALHRERLEASAE